MKNQSIAIDGPSAAGKSTLARRLAAELGFLYVDTGAIYRTVALKAKEQGLDPAQRDAVAALLPALDIRLAYDGEGQQRMYLDGRDVSEAIRAHEISDLTSKISGIGAVRDYLLEQQRKLAQENSVVMDGRDIGTVVLPEADVKLFLTADAKARAKRRYNELLGRGQQVDFETILRDVEARDEQDCNRPVAPLRQAEDAVLVDTTNLNFAQSLEVVMNIVKERLKL